MKKLLVAIFCFISLSATIVNNDFVEGDLNVLKDLDIESSYIKDQNFQNFYNKFSSKYQNSYINSLNNGGDYIPEISTILKENNVPSVFLYMAMAESNFVLEAKSPKQALGLWQFMPGTAKQFGLKKNNYVDERMDFIKSTEAAVKYLTRLHNIFGSWYLAALSYNCGDGRLIEGITRATIDMYCEENDCSNNKIIQAYKKTLKDYERGRVKYTEVRKIYNEVKEWEYKPTINHLLKEKKGANRQYLPDESRNYIKKIISLAMMNNNQQKFVNNKNVINQGANSSLARVDVSGGMLLKNIASLAGVTTDRLKELNPHLKKNITPPSDTKTQLYIPQSKLAVFNENKKNNLKNIPLEDKKKNILEDDLENFESDYVKTYVVKKGDTIYSIAKKFNTTTEKIMKENNLKSTKLKKGNKIVIKVQ